MPTKRGQLRLSSQTVRIGLVIGVLAVGTLATVPARATMSTCWYQKTEDTTYIQTVSPPTVRLFVTPKGDFQWEDPNSDLSGDCGIATVNNTDTVHHDDFNTAADLELTLDLRRMFAPGMTPEGKGKSEIEFDIDGGKGDNKLIIWGGKRADAIVFGEAGIGYNKDSDYDIDHSNFNDFLVLGKGRADFLSGNGLADSVNPGPFPQPITVYGNDGADEILGSDEGDHLFGLGGRDLIRGLGMGDVLQGNDRKDVLFGGHGHDELDGAQGGDRLRGNGGADDLEGNGGIDNCGGGPGNDILATCETGPGD